MLPLYLHRLQDVQRFDDHFIPDLEQPEHQQAQELLEWSDGDVLRDTIPVHVSTLEKLKLWNHNEGWFARVSIVEDCFLLLLCSSHCKVHSFGEKNISKATLKQTKNGNRKLLHTGPTGECTINI